MLLVTSSYHAVNIINDVNAGKATMFKITKFKIIKSFKPPNRHLELRGVKFKFSPKIILNFGLWNFVPHPGMCNILIVFSLTILSFNFNTD